ncbi:MAG: ferritin-like domain-containing protein [Rhodospirillales bacterium]
MKHWTLDDIPWDRFDASKVNADILRLAKAAAMVEQNGLDYALYLHNVFADDEQFRSVIDTWAREEVQHGSALGRWAMLADPTFDFAESSARFRAGYQLPLDATSSIRGSRAGELMARCIVETGTSSYYAALHDAIDEPVLKAICGQIAADELRHYKLFYSHMKRYLTREKLGTLGRLRIGFSRILESEDDELAYAYYVANGGSETYDRKRNTQAHALRAYRVYKPSHIQRAIAMAFKAVGLKPHGLISRVLLKFTCWFQRRRIARLEQLAAA